MYWFSYVSPDGEVVKQNQNTQRQLLLLVCGEFQEGEAYAVIVHNIAWVPFTLHAYKSHCEISKKLNLKYTAFMTEELSVKLLVMSFFFVVNAIHYVFRAKISISQM